jgi:hypothetical protein
MGVVDDDEDTPDVTDRVARVSFVEGTAKVKRADSQDWEAITLNLPLVEGDEIATDGASRLELQFGKNQYVRIAENSSLTIVTLRDDGIALSLCLGTATTHVDSFDKGKAFFEIDAPKSTVAIEKSGTFRIDAGQADAKEVRIAASDGGEAHVYSDNAGFALKNGRSATISIDGTNAGEWQTADAATDRDEFDAWSAGRDLIVADKLKKAHYNNYYDDDIFGADDLDGFGEWVHTSQYGWVWRPDSSAISGYADWSPYRYGHWAWMPPFGWIWVNDEPWGWATYHHGRWVFDNGYWAWAPYPYYRPHRSWWLPALVTINIIDTNVCWYPLSYRHHYKWDYWGHRGHDDHGRWEHGRDANAKNGDNRYLGPPTRDGGPIGRDKRPPADVPPGSVVGVKTDEFGRGGRGIRSMPPEIAKVAFDREPPSGETLALVRDRGDKMAPALRTEPPSRESQIEHRRTEVGAGTRTSGTQLDKDLEKTRIFGGRTPKPVDRTPPTLPPGGTVQDNGRPTGVVERDKGDHHGREGGPVRNNGDSDKKPADKGVVDTGIRPPLRDGGTPKSDEPKDAKPRFDPRTEPQRDPRPEPKIEPNNESKPHSEPRSEPRAEPRSQPKSDPPAKSEPKASPAPKSEPKSEPKASPPSKSDDHPSKSKDG